MGPSRQVSGSGPETLEFVWRASTHLLPRTMELGEQPQGAPQAPTPRGGPGTRVRPTHGAAPGHVPPPNGNAIPGQYNRIFLTCMVSVGIF